jgi:hypothetical protein
MAGKAATTLVNGAAKSDSSNDSETFKKYVQTNTNQKKN